MTDEQLAAIETWAQGPSGHHTTQDVVDYAGAAKRIVPDLIAELRRLRAERLTAEERETVLCALCSAIDYENDYLRGDGVEARVKSLMAVRAKIEAARDGGEG